MSFLSSTVISAGTLLLGLYAGCSGAQAYPAKPIRFIVPGPAGGGADITARIVGEKLSASLGQPVITDNRSGAAGTIGAELAAQSVADGYSILLGHAGAIAINVSLLRNLRYDPIMDFAPISLIATVPNVLLTHPSVPVKSVNELIRLAKTRPGQLNFASSGTGQQAHLAGEMFKSMAGIDIVHVPYKGSPGALTDLISGQVQLMFANVLPALPHVKSRRLRGLAVTGPKRSPAMPDLPTVAEAALPGFEVSQWFGVLAPAKTPQAIITTLNSEFVRIMNLSDVRMRLLNQGAEPLSSTPEVFAAYIKEEIDRWAKVIKGAGITPE